MSDDRSPEYTITIHEGTYDVLEACLIKVYEVGQSLPTPDTYEDLARNQRQMSELKSNLLSNLIRLLRGRDYDGPLHLSPDTAPLRLFFRYEKSGYCGAMIFHADSGNWSIHT
jgi:hypothetical protein